MNQSLSASTFAALMPAPPPVTAAWRPFFLQVIDRETPLHLTAAAFADHVLTTQICGTPRLRQEVSGRAVEGLSGPGSVNLAPADFRATWDASGRSRVIQLFIPHTFLLRVITEDWQGEPRQVEIVPQFLARDPVVEGVVTRLAREAQNGSPSGQLYAESASEFLAHHIIHTYSSLSPHSSRAHGGLAGYRLKVVLDYIHDSLAQPISLRALAELARVSARHFERAFRQAVGVPPHAYVLGKRVTAARELLLSEPALTVEEIAARVGFSSSSHLASAFRRHTGYSPARFRRHHAL